MRIEKLLAISDESKQNKVNRTSTDIAVQRVLVQKTRSEN